MSTPDVITDPPTEVSGVTGEIAAPRPTRRRRRRRRATVVPDPPAVTGIVHDKLPNFLTTTELMRVLNLKPSAFYVQLRNGKYRRLEAKDPPSPTKRFSGLRVTSYLTRQGPPK